MPSKSVDCMTPGQLTTNAIGGPGRVRLRRMKLASEVAPNYPGRQVMVHRHRP